MLPADTTKPIKLTPASQFTYEQLAAIYNQTRVDYMVPMPMNAARLADYVSTYDVDLNHSMVAVTQSGEMLGVAMLGVREGRVLDDSGKAIDKPSKGHLAAALSGSRFEGRSAHIESSGAVGR